MVFTQLTLDPSLGLGEFVGLGAHCTPDSDFTTATKTYKSWINLCGTTSPEQCDHTVIEANGIRFVRVPVEAPHGLTKDTAKAVVDAIDSLPRPVMIQCATANRASAVLALYLGSKQQWSAYQTFNWAATNSSSARFLGTQPLRNWLSFVLGPAPPVTNTMHGNVIFRQLFEPVSSTYTYLLGDPVTREAIIIDPVVDKAERDANIVRELGLKLTIAANTHVHADHISGTAKLKTFLPHVKSAIAAVSGARADICLSEGDKISFGNRYVRVLSTPGHTDGCLSFVLDDNTAIFTGDALLIRGCGRTDFQQGSAEKLYESITTKVFTLPDTCYVYPGHDYNGHLLSTVGEEKAYNNRLGYGRTLEQFKDIMANLNLAPPKQLDKAVPANLIDGNEVMEAGLPAPGTVLPLPCQACRQDGNTNASSSSSNK